ncbi:unnamed protein product [Moneuplotes crassus]|uniref:Uncharacterized protein n=1 Tax=Euplotes crassus TaxID=5936 RepID=A0AAD1XYI0_EUPCR|nr:unnamed protein product [Moneuplotes crassus]
MKLLNGLLMVFVILITYKSLAQCSTLLVLQDFAELELADCIEDSSDIFLRNGIMNVKYSDASLLGSAITLPSASTTKAADDFYIMSLPRLPVLLEAIAC